MRQVESVGHVPTEMTVIFAGIRSNTTDNDAISMSADAISGNAIFKSAGEGDTHDSLIGLSGQAW